jgi:hypothetical protein
MPKRLVPIFGLMAVWLGLNQSAALAYESCIPPAPIEALQMADIVFAGKAIEANQQTWRSHIKFDWRPPFIHLDEDRDRYRSTFEVAMVWKGEVTARTSIIHSIASCGASYSFRKGEEYIVYAKWFEGELYNAWCHRNNPLVAAREDLLAFGVGKPPISHPSSLADLARRLIVLFLILALLGWVTRGLRRKYGDQKS